MPIRYYKKIAPSENRAIITTTEANLIWRLGCHSSSSYLRWGCPAIERKVDAQHQRQGNSPKRMGFMASGYTEAIAIL